MFKDIHVGTLSPALRQGTKERFQKNPTLAYGELAVRNLSRTVYGTGAAVGLLAISAGFILHDAFASGLYASIFHENAQAFSANPLRFAGSHALDIVTHNPLIALPAVLAAPAGVAGVGSIAPTLWRTGEFAVSLGEDIYKKARPAIAHRPRVAA